MRFCLQRQGRCPVLLAVARCMEKDEEGGRRAGRSEEVADGELEIAALFVGQRLEREAPLEAQGSERREPPDADAPRGADIEKATEPKTGVRHVEGRGGSGIAVELLEVPGVSEVG